MQLIAVPLSIENFLEYGDVVEHRGTETRRMLNTPLEHSSLNLRLGFSVNRLTQSPPGAVQINTLERHPYSAQTFIPLIPSRHLVVVALSDDDGHLDPKTLKAFLTNGRQGVSYRAAVWHFAFTAIDTDSEVAVILGRTGGNDDTEYTTLHAEVILPS